MQQNGLGVLARAAGSIQFCMIWHHSTLSTLQPGSTKYRLFTKPPLALTMPATMMPLLFCSALPHSPSPIITHHHPSSLIITHHHSSSLIITHYHSSSLIITHPSPPQIMPKVDVHSGPIFHRSSVDPGTIWVILGTNFKGSRGVPDNKFLVNF